MINAKACLVWVKAKSCCDSYLEVLLLTLSQIHGLLVLIYCCLTNSGLQCPTKAKQEKTRFWEVAQNLILKEGLEYQRPHDYSFPKARIYRIFVFFMVIVSLIAVLVLLPNYNDIVGRFTRLEKEYDMLKSHTASLEKQLHTESSPYGSRTSDERQGVSSERVQLVSSRKSRLHTTKQPATMTPRASRCANYRQLPVRGQRVALGLLAHYDWSRALQCMMTFRIFAPTHFSGVDDGWMRDYRVPFICPLYVRGTGPEAHEISCSRIPKRP